VLVGDDPCSPPASGGEHIEFFEKVELKMLEQRERLGRHYIEELVDRSLLAGCWRS